MSTPLTNCPSCTAPVPRQASVCPSCGAFTPNVDAPGGARPARTSAPLDTDELAAARAADAIFDAHLTRLERLLGPEWTLRRLIGRGGYAEVYAAWDVRLKRDVAIKTLRHDVPFSAAVLQRFRLEAEAIAKLRHPHIIPIYTVGEGDGLVYFVMPLIDGESLAAVIDREGRLPVPESLRILKEAAGALGAAHRAGVVHRDVKPENIMLEGPERRAIVMDFGIAKLEDAELRKLTATGLVVGTPQYMSPEQATGDRPADHRSDQYALAAVGYRILAGRLPFESPSITSLMYKQVTETPPPLYAVRADVSSTVENALMRALSKDPARRFASMDEFAAALGPTGESALVTPSRLRLTQPAAPAIRVARARETVARWRLPAIVLGVLGILVFALTLPNDTPARAVAAASRRGEMEYLARQFLQQLGAPSRAAERSEFVAQDSVFSFVQRATPRARAQEVAADVGTWRWHVWRYDRRSNEVWSVELGDTGRVLAFAHLLPDSAPGARLSADSARALAEAALRARGVDVARLRFVDNGMTPRPGRTDHTFTWARTDGALRASSGDSAVRMIEVGVAGDRVSRYDERLDLGAVRTPPSHSLARRAGAMLGIVGCVFFLGYLVALVIQQTRTDELQWGAALRVSVVSVVPLMTWVGVNQLRDLVAPARPLTDSLAVAAGYALIRVILIFGAGVTITQLLFAATESVTLKVRPAIVEGLDELTRGRLLVPELPAAVLVGYGAGFVVSGIAGSVAALSAALLGQITSASVADAFDFVVPSLMMVPYVTASVAAGLVMLYLIVVPAARGGGRWSVLVPPVLFALLSLMYEGSPLLWLYVFLPVLGICVVLWRFGFVAGALAFFVAETLANIGQMLWSGEPQFVMSALIAAALLAVPGLLAYLAHVKYARRFPVASG